ncbi:cytochrome P40 monooxygenase [Hyaloscypha finlandica]|nr:cytochrome P40 monooxygenase [Hyaloscypha finlandica]
MLIISLSDSRAQLLAPKYAIFYRQSDVGSSIGTDVDPIRHQETRKLLAPGFSAPALKAQTSIVVKYVDKVVDQIKKKGEIERGMNMTQWFMWTAFDIIMDLSFGESLTIVEEGKGHVWVTMLSGSGFQVALGYIMRRQHPIFVKILTRILLNKSSKHMREQHVSMSRGMAIKRLNNKFADRVDLFSHLVGDKAHNTTVDFLASQGSTLVTAGTETTSTFLSAATYYLLRNPEVLEKLKTEVRSAFASSGEIDGENTKLLYLNAVVEEGLRIFPPAPFGLPRVCPGAMTDGVWVPKGTIVATAAHTTASDPRYFHLPREFHPERWLPSDHPDYDIHLAGDTKEASKPFSLGPRWCIGSSLSYLEIRITLAKLVWNFDWKSALDVSGDFVEDARLLGLWRAPPLMVNYTIATH